MELDISETLFYFSFLLRHRDAPVKYKSKSMSEDETYEKPFVFFKSFLGDIEFDL